MNRTLEEIRTLGLEALRERLGRAGMIRFLQQFAKPAKATTLANDTVGLIKRAN